MAYRWLYTHINEQFLHHVANFLFVCVLTTLYLQSNHNSVTPLSLAFNFSPWICIDSSPPFYRYIRVKDEPERWIIGIIYPCSLQSCAASADVTMLQQLDEFFQEKRERACLLYTAYPEGNEKLPTAKGKDQLPWYNKYMQSVFNFFFFSFSTQG